jgi:hypothetical protein
MSDSQLALEFESREERAAALLLRLRRLGLVSANACALTRNRYTMASMSRGTLRVHESFARAPDSVLMAIVEFFTARRRTQRAAARVAIVNYAAPSIEQVSPRPRRTAADDATVSAKLAEWHSLLNEKHFCNKLKAMQPHVSRRMRRRLGHYSPANEKFGTPAEIVISRRHLRRDGFRRALETLLHEMVHQWQDENGLPLDHGKNFRRKAREVGIAPFASRPRDLSLSE